MIEVQTSGFAELDAALHQLPKALQRGVMLTALKKAAQPIVEAAKAKAPRGTDDKRRGSKKQRKSGESAEIGHGADSIAARAVRSDSPTSATVAVGPDAKHWYMKFAEFGTAHESPRRFLTPAFEENKLSVADRVGVELWAALQAKAAQLAGQAGRGALSDNTRRAFNS